MLFLSILCLILASFYWRFVVSTVVGLYNLVKLMIKGPRYFTQDLAPQTMQQSDSIICKSLLPCGLLNIGIINGPDGNSVVHLLNSHDDSEFRMTLNIFKHIVPGFIENKTDASFFIRSDKAAFLDRQRSLIPYARNPRLLAQMFDQAGIEFRLLLDDWAKQKTSQSIDYNITQVIFRVISRVFFGLDKMDFEKVYRTNKLIEEALNFGSIPNRFRFLSSSQQLVLRASQAYTETYRELLEMNAESILASDNYTSYIVRQCAELKNSKNIRDYISHDDVLASSPLLYLGIANITASLGHLFLQYHQPGKTTYLQALRDEIQQLPSETLEAAQASRLLETHYLEIVRLTRPASMVTRMTSKPVTCGNLILPANTLFGIVGDSLLVDPKHWGDNATEFDPERFSRFPLITGTHAKQYPNVTHGLGPRSCPGDLIAYNMALAFLLACFNGRYRFILDPTNPPISEVGSAGALSRLSERFRAKVINTEWEEIDLNKTE